MRIGLLDGGPAKLSEGAMDTTRVVDAIANATVGGVLASLERILLAGLIFAVVILVVWAAVAFVMWRFFRRAL